MQLKHTENHYIKNNSFGKAFIKRLEEIYRLIKEDGSIFLQCDYRLSAYIQILAEKCNFMLQNKIIWKKGETGKGAKASKSLSKDYDEIIHITKNNNFKFNKINNPHSINSLKEYKYYDNDRGKYFKIVQLGMYSKLSISKMEEENMIYVSSSGKKYMKKYLEDFNSTCLSDIWMDCHNLYNGGNKEMVNYDTQKPKALLERIIAIFSKEGDIVADFFLGSGTTCVVAKEMNRFYIGCDINPRAIQVSNLRLNKGVNNG